MITQEAVLDIAREAVYAIVIVSAPMLLVALIVGLIISIFQTVTSIQEQTLTFVPKVLAIVGVLVLFGPWMISVLTNYITELYSSMVIIQKHHIPEADAIQDKIC